MNVHHSRWDANTNEDERGEQLANKIHTLDYTILNEYEATPLLTNGRSTLPDISLASNDIALLSDWSVSTSLARDHHHQLSMINWSQRTYINFKKADRARCAECGETRTVEQTGKTFWKAVSMARGLFIPAGCIRHFQKTLPASAKSLSDERDRRHRLNPADEMLNDINKQIKKLVVEDKQIKWQSAVDKCYHRTGLLHLWRQKNTQPPINLSSDMSKRQLKRQFHQLPLT